VTCVDINLYGNVTGSGIANYIPIWTGSNTLGNSIIYQSGGNIGIGTTTPSEKLDIEGGSADVYLKLHTADGYSSGIKMYGGSVDIWGIRYSDTDNKLYIEKDGTQYVSVISGGNVGIGTTSPSYKLDVAGDIRGQNNLYVSGNVGIGTTSPIKKLDVVGDINATGYVYGLTGLCIGTDCRTAWPTGAEGPWDNTTIWTFIREGYPLNVNISNILFVNATTGNVGIGTDIPTEKLEIQGRVLVASSNPFELEPSDGILDVKGSINATVAFYVPKNSTQPFVCDSSKEGAIFFNTTDRKFYGCTGTEWVIIGSQA
ncbi:MAG: hypothetical protein QXL73_06405, partial [Thermoplasmata archaeon]